jgi:DNA polymerase III subunit delta'
MLSAIIGQDKVKEKLTTFLSGDVTGTYLFYGPNNVGKRTSAFEIARFLLCGTKQKNCSCRSCKKFNEDHPDFLCIGRSDKIKVKDIDLLLEFSYLSPFFSRYKITVIDNADNITWEAANRLLKILEEPPPGFVFFLISSNPEAIIPTILSRCIKYEFSVLSKGNLISIIRKKLGFETEKAVILGNIATVVSLNVFDKASQYLRYRDMALNMLSAFKKNGLLTVLDCVDKIDREEVPIFADMFLLLLTDILLTQNKISLIANSDLSKDIEKMSLEFKEKALLIAVDIFSQLKRNLYLNVNMPCVLKNSLIKVFPLLTIEAV